MDNHPTDRATAVAEMQRTIDRIRLALARHGIVCAPDQVAVQVERVLQVLSYFVGGNQTAKRRRRL